MKNIKLSIISTLLLTVLLSYNSWAQQSKAAKEELESGYKGGGIEGLETADSALSFLVIGDWGRSGEYGQKDVAIQMAKASVSADAAFVISTGDNFYPAGVKSTQDPQWQRSFENVYSQHSLQIDWFSVLGNHDYKSNPQAQIEYSAIAKRWNMPSRYFSYKLPISNDDTTKKILFVYMDTNPLVQKYYEDESYKANVISQDTSAQMKWLKNTLADKDPAIKWKIVIGHHPLYSSGKRVKSPETAQIRKSLEKIFTQNKVDIYLCGHEHHLEYLKSASNPTHHFISGAGSEIRPMKNLIPESKFRASDFGFMLFSITNNQFRVVTINGEGKIINDQNIKK